MTKIGIAPHYRAMEAADGAVVRTVLFAVVFLVTCISFRPFQSLADPTEISASGDLANQLGYSALFLALAAWCIAHDPRPLLALVRPVLVVTLLWFAICVVSSWEPSLSTRRLAFALATVGIAGMVMLLPKNVRHFSDLLTAVVLIVLVVCYLGVFFAPQLSIHQATDFIEPELAGDWRGAFGHKNEAGATMALFVFNGLFIARTRNLLLGSIIVVLAAIFLFFTESKTSMVVLPLVLFMSVAIQRSQKPLPVILFALLLLAVFNLITLGSVYIKPVHYLLEATIDDPSFTGRSDIWKFAIDHLRDHLFTGYGFSTFWGTDQVLYGMEADQKWINAAGHAHNGYLDLALTIGIPGMIFVTLWLIVLPLADYCRCLRQQSAGQLGLLFLRTCLFAAYQSCFESVFMETGQHWVFLVMAAFGLRFLSVARLTD